MPLNKLIKFLKNRNYNKQHSVIKDWMIGDIFLETGLFSPILKTYVLKAMDDSDAVVLPEFNLPEMVVSITYLLNKCENISLKGRIRRQQIDEIYSRSLLK